ncbi:MAG: hypothetical protein AB7Y46_09575 [Armatimonadota bacterium]
MSELRPPLWSGLRPSELLPALATPPDRYRPIPWLAWTGELHWETLRAQLDQMLAQGITEFFLFPIYGMELPYMSAAYWGRVRQTLEHCRAIGMKCWIYDEYNWPSGIAAGAVIRDFPQARERLLWLRFEEPGEEHVAMPSGVTETTRSGGIEWATAVGGVMRTSVRGGDWVSGMPGYLDMLSAHAAQRFLVSTHEKYLARAPEMFGHTIPGFFTDEPGFYHPRLVAGWLPMPFTEGLFQAFEARWGYDLRERLGELILDGPTAQRTRCHYWRLVSERYSEAYGGTIRRWCDEHRVALTGHCLGEEGLALHVRMSGDLWEALRHYTVPGIDMLANADGFTYPERMSFYGQVHRRAFHLTCKYVHGVCRHTGAREMLSEAYGVCDWGMNLFRQKRGFHYQVALGVTMFNDNSLITSIADFRKYAIAGKHFTQPWWRHYRLYADYNARVAALHAEGEPVAEIAVLFPRSAAWAAADGAIFAHGWFDLDPDHPMGRLQEQIYGLLDELIREQWHFDFIFEPVLAHARVEGDELVTEHARYRVLVVPSATWLPRGVLDVLAQFAAAGGRIILAGELPAREVDTMADLSGEVADMLAGAGARQIGATGAELSAALGEISARPMVIHGEARREFITSWRRIAGTECLLVANMVEAPVDVEIEVGLDGPMVMLDPDTLECYRPAVPRFAWHFEPWQAFVLMVGEAAAPEVVGGDLPVRPAWLASEAVEELDGAWEFGLRPGNMLRLQVQVRPDPENLGASEGWQRDAGGEGWLTPEDGRLAAPITPGDAPWYWLRARVTCVGGAQPHTIVADNPDTLELFVNGRPAEQVVAEPLWTEENVHFDVRDMFAAGENAVHVRVRTSKYNDPRISAFPGVTEHLLQPLAIVGDFRVEGEATLVAPSDQIRVDSPWEAQGIPHAAAVGIYRRTIEYRPGERVMLHLPACTDAVEVLVNGRSAGARAWPPYVFDLSGLVRPGANALEIRVCNTLGNLITRTYAGAMPPVLPQSGLLAAPRLLRWWQTARESALTRASAPPGSRARAPRE